MCTSKNIFYYLAKLKKRDDFLLLDNRSIALGFISEVLGINISGNLEEIQKEYYEVFGKKVYAEHIYEEKEMPIHKDNGEIKIVLVDCIKETIIKDFELKSEDEFYNSILEKALHMKGGDIKDIFNSYFIQAVKDLKEINDIISKCEKKLKNKEIDQYLKNKLEYFVRLNTSAKEEIINFLCNDINNFIINDMSIISRKLNNVYMLNRPYSCYKYGSFYNPQENFSLQVKFFDLSAGNMEPYQIYKNNKEEYYKYIEKYILDNNFVKELIDNISYNYLLQPRKEFLIQIFNTYEREEYMAFIALCTIQIEGLFSDYLKILDPKYKEGTITLVPKLNKIKENNFFYGYEYFTFEFPKLRNKMAHGENLNIGNIKRIANEVLLDLRYVINLFNDRNLQPNVVLNILKNITDINEATLNCITLLFSNTYSEKYIFTNDRENVIYENYMEKIKAIRANVLKAEFWEFFKEKLSKEDLNFSYYDINMINMDLHKLLNILRDIAKKCYSQSDYAIIYKYCNEINIHIGKIEKERKEKNKKFEEFMNSRIRNDKM